MSKIFIAFFNAVHNPARPQDMPCFYESFVKELAERGNELLVMHHRLFSHDFGPMPEELRQEIAAFSPDVALIFNNAFYDLSACFEFPIYIYEVDSVLHYSNKEVLKKKQGRFHYIVPQVSSIDAVQQHLGVDRKQLCYVPFFTSVRREPLPKTMNISFIGTRFLPYGKDGKTPWNRFMLSEPSAAAVSRFKQALEDVRRNPYIPQSALLDRFQSSDFDAARFLNRNELMDTLSGSIRILTLSEVSDLGLVIFGTKGWYMENSVDPCIPLAYDRRAVFSLKHNQDVYNASRLAINVNHLQATTGFSWRVCDIMASDACLVSEYRPDFARCFPGVPVPLFTSRYEARALCRKLLEDEALRQDIVAQCNDVIDRKYRFENLVPVLEDFLKTPLRTDTQGAARVEAFDAAVGRVVKEPSAAAPQASFRKSRKDFKRRCKLFGYLALLTMVQLPGLHLCTSAARRERLLQKINKYW